MEGLKEIKRVLQDYFDMLYYCDLKKFDTIFHPQAIYATTDESPSLFRGMAEYRAVIAKRESPASRNEIRADAINNIELAGENTARARLECSIGENKFVDFLTLVRDNEQWKIIAKVFHIIDKEN